MGNARYRADDWFLTQRPPSAVFQRSGRTVKRSFNEVVGQSSDGLSINKISDDTRQDNEQDRMGESGDEFLDALSLDTFGQLR